MHPFLFALLEFDFTPLFIFSSETHFSFFCLRAPGKHLDDVNARTLHKPSGHSNNNADYALVDMMATSSHPLHYNSSHGDGTQEGHSSVSNRGGELELGPQSTHSRTSLASQHKKGKVEYS